MKLVFHIPVAASEQSLVKVRGTDDIFKNKTKKKKKKMPAECVGEETTAGAAHGVTWPHPAIHRLALRPSFYFKGQALGRHHGTSPLRTAVTSQQHELAPLGTPELSCDVTSRCTS